MKAWCSLDEFRRWVGGHLPVLLGRQGRNRSWGEGRPEDDGLAWNFHHKGGAAKDWAATAFYFVTWANRSSWSTGALHCLSLVTTKSAFQSDPRFVIDEACKVLH